MNDNIYLSDGQLQTAIVATAGNGELAELNALLRRTASIRAERPESADQRGALLLVGDKPGLYTLMRTVDGDSEIVSLHTSESEADDLRDLGALSEGEHNVSLSVSYEPLNDPDVIAAAVAQYGWGCCNECGNRVLLVAAIAEPETSLDDDVYVCAVCADHARRNNPELDVSDLDPDETQRIAELLRPEVADAIAQLARATSQGAN